MEQNDLAVARVFVRKAPKARADLHEPAPGPGQQALESDPVAPVLILPAGPEEVPVPLIGVGRIRNDR